VKCWDLKLYNLIRHWNLLKLNLHCVKLYEENNKAKTRRTYSAHQVANWRISKKKIVEEGIEIDKKKC
jgi:hypothetical protein